MSKHTLVKCSTCGHRYPSDTARTCPLCESPERTAVKPGRQSFYMTRHERVLLETLCLMKAREAEERSKLKDLTENEVEGHKEYAKVLTRLAERLR